MSTIKELEDLIIKSLWYCPCTEDQLTERDFLKNISLYGIGKILQYLERVGAIYYKGKSDVMYVSKSWVKKNRKYLINEMNS